MGHWRENIYVELSDEKSVVENIRRFTYGLLELGDGLFVRKEFVDRMANFIEARGYKSLDEVPEEAFDAATQSALKATFKDDNRITRLVSGINVNINYQYEFNYSFSEFICRLKCWLIYSVYVCLLVQMLVQGKKKSL